MADIDMRSGMMLDSNPVATVVDFLITFWKGPVECYLVIDKGRVNFQI